MSKTDRLLSAVPDASDYRIDWQAIGRGALAPFIDAMKTTGQNPKYHAEGSVWNHTTMVCEQLVSDPYFRVCSPRCRQELFLAALFHDVGKITTTKLENGELVSPNHAIVGAGAVREMLIRDYGVCGTAELMAFREAICFMIRYHMTAPYIMGSDDPGRRLMRVASNGELTDDFTLERLLTLSRADATGKIAEDNAQIEQTVLTAGEAAKEKECYAGPRRFASPFTEYACLSGRNVAPDVPLYNDTSFEVVMMCGLPGVGKDTYIGKHYPDRPMISLDEIRREYGISPAQDQQEVIRIAKARAKELLRAKRSFVWNATCLTQAVRTRLVSLFTKYNAYVRIVYLEADFETNLRRNRERRYAVPQNVMDSMLSKLSPPERFEAHEVEWKCI